MKTLRYRDPASTQTLAEGIAELRAAEGAQGDATQYVAPELLDDIDVHDAVHVLFGCSTDLRGEIIAHVWTALGTTMRLRDMQRVNRHEDHRETLAEIGHRRLLKSWAKGLPRVLATVAHALRMKRRWPAADFDRYLDRRLCDIRREFGIRLPPPEPIDQPRAGAALRTIHARATRGALG